MPPFWIPIFSKADAWRQSASPAEIEHILARFSDAAVEKIVRSALGMTVLQGQQALPHLLRHWALCVFRYERIALHRPLPETARTQVKALGRTLAALQTQLQALEGEAFHLLSLGMDAKLPIRTTALTLAELQEAADLLEAAATLILSRPGKVGRPPIDVLVEDIRALAEIYVDVTGKRPSRTYDPILGEEVSAFTRFAKAVFEALHPGKAISLDSAIRQVVSTFGDGENSSAPT